MPLYEERLQWPRIGNFFLSVGMTVKI